mmetsp:Transcript_7925/g.19131  ORF Transcript_7925/g.19131 Transcript_7925/m.19131 type:complete len:472 (+) Transcript_7925:121-1536(+)
MVIPGSEQPILLNDWQCIYEYISIYGAHIALWPILSAMTVYRREISCNRSYHEDEDESEHTRTKDDNTLVSRESGNQNAEKELMTEELLDGAGLYCSGRPLLSFAELLWLGFDGYESDDMETTVCDLTPEDLLDRVGNYAYPEPLLATLSFFSIWKKTLAAKVSQPSSFLHENHGCDPLSRNIPPDVHVHIASFLDPRDVVNLACVSKAYHAITHDPNNTTSAAIWKTLWHRDYAWVVFRWKIGKQAFERSNCRQWSYSKEFYFLFGQSYLDYVLTGHNTMDSCLVGIHSNIYNITPFLFSHPGSPDTLMVHSGRDATGFFDDMGHSIGARKLAMSMCVVVNRSAQNKNDECGLYPTTHTHVDEDERDYNSYPLPPRLADGEDNLLKARRKRLTRFRTGDDCPPNGGGTLYQIRKRFTEERERIRNRNTRIYSNDPTILGHEVNTYFDPFRREWLSWYTDTDLKTIYLPGS